MQRTQVKQGVFPPTTSDILLLQYTRKRSKSLQIKDFNEASVSLLNDKMRYLSFVVRSKLRVRHFNIPKKP
jgi:hypothetical protein